MYYAVLINYFNSIQGFDVLVTALEKKDVTLAEIYWCIRPFYFVPVLYSSTYALASFLC